MKKSIFWIWLIVIVAVVVVVATTTVSLAIWQRNEHANTYIRTPITDENPSLKYQMYVPVVASGDDSTTTTSAYRRLAGTFAVANDVYSYTLTDASQLDSIVGFSLAGWFGGVALEYMEVPAEVTVSVNGTQVTKPVVRIMPETDYAAYGFGGVKTAIKSLVLGGNVIEVAQGAFYGMAYLESIILKEGTDPVYLYPYCFGGCVNLVSLNNRRETPEGWSIAMITAGSSAMQ